MKKERIYILDTTLRDGLQAPNTNPVNIKQRLEIGALLANMNVDIIEAGFAIGSKNDFGTIKGLASMGLDNTICSLARSMPADIDAAGEAIKGARRGRIHTFISTSPIHMTAKLNMTPEEVLDNAVKGIKMASKYTDDIQFSLEDYTRTEKDFAFRMVEAVINAGATTVNLPDTVGYTLPQEFKRMVIELLHNVPNSDKAIFSTHCHNDLGLAVANSLAGVIGGARQIECTINGLGERAGNAAMEEIIMAYHVRGDRMLYKNNIITEKFKEASDMLAKYTDAPVQKNKAIVGINAFAHESGIHQHGVGKDARTYEIMTPKSVGWGHTTISLGVTSGSDGLMQKSKELGYNLSKEDIKRIYPMFMQKAEKGRVSDDDFRAIIENVLI
ncbi:MAG: 2-isopropylmalate synthase [bacterium]|jgi:2-isopropylmalate synthase